MFISNLTSSEGNTFDFFYPQPYNLIFLVEAMGHINFAHDMDRDVKGILDNLVINGKVVECDWKITSLPFDENWATT